MMEHSIFTKVKVNNEMELCEIFDPQCKQLIERELLANRISYYLKWGNTGLFSRNKALCTICVNENAIDLSEEIVRNVCDEMGYQVKFLLKRSKNKFF